MTETETDKMIKKFMEKQKEERENPEMVAVYPKEGIFQDDRYIYELTKVPRVNKTKPPTARPKGKKKREQRILWDTQVKSHVGFRQTYKVQRDLRTDEVTIALVLDGGGHYGYKILTQHQVLEEIKRLMGCYKLLRYLNHPKVNIQKIGDLSNKSRGDSASKMINSSVLISKKVNFKLKRLDIQDLYKLWLKFKKNATLREFLY